MIDYMNNIIDKINPQEKKKSVDENYRILIKLTTMVSYGIYLAITQNW